MERVVENMSLDFLSLPFSSSATALYPQKKYLGAKFSISVSLTTLMLLFRFPLLVDLSS